MLRLNSAEVEKAASITKAAGRAIAYGVCLRADFTHGKDSCLCRARHDPYRGGTLSGALSRKLSPRKATVRGGKQGKALCGVLDIIRAMAIKDVPALLDSELATVEEARQLLKADSTASAARRKAGRPRKAKNRQSITCTTNFEVQDAGARSWSCF